MTMTTSIPSALYAHPDPLLSRLRLNDSKGNFIDKPAASSSELRDVKVIGLLFGAEVERERGQFAREFYKSVAELSRRNPHRFKCIYVSIDPTEELMEESCRNKGWLSCIWNDGSNAGNNPAALATIENDEDFILDPNEDLPDEKLDFSSPLLAESSSSSSKDNKNKKLYKRPYARVGLGQKFDILSTPTLIIYNLETRTFLSKRVKATEIRSDHADETMKAWMSGKESPHAKEIGVREMVQSIKWTVALGVVYFAYWLMKRYGQTTFSLSPILQTVFVPKELRDDFTDSTPKVEL